MESKKISTRKQNLTQLGLAVAIIVFVCYLAQIVFFRIDLTSEKRYTLSPVTKKVLRNMQDEVLVRIYLEGEMPLGFKRLNKSVHDMLDEFRIYSGRKIQYDFIDLSKITDLKKRNAVLEELYNKGLQPTNVQVKDKKGGTSQQILVPGILVSRGKMELPVNLLSNNQNATADENLNLSAENLEYLLIRSITNVLQDNIRKVAFLEGQGELNDMETADITRELANFYQVDRGQINGNMDILKAYNVVIIARPTKPFSEEDKFALDQYVMNGGKLIFFHDGARVESDSLASGNTLAFVNQTNIDDILFRYGIRVNPNLVQDIQCALIPINTALAGDNAKFAPVPWLYYPLLLPSNEHPATRNLDLVRSEFSSSIDTLAEEGAKTSVLLRTSPFTKLVDVPVYISLQEVRKKPEKKDFTKSSLPIAVIREGAFTSAFRHRMRDNLKLTGEYTFKESSAHAMIAVVADGDIIRNQVRMTANGPALSPLGFDRFTKQTFGNKDFVVNLVNYMADDAGIMSLRNRDIRLRLLDRARLQEEDVKWKIINTLFPVLFVLAVGIGVFYWRRRKYTKI